MRALVGVLDEPRLRAPAGKRHLERVDDETVHGFLDEVRVDYCGRYGSWDHAWTDEAFMRGEETAARVLAGMG